MNVRAAQVDGGHRLAPRCLVAFCWHFAGVTSFSIGLRRQLAVNCPANSTNRTWTNFVNRSCALHPVIGSGSWSRKRDDVAAQFARRRSIAANVHDQPGEDLRACCRPDGAIPDVESIQEGCLFQRRFGVIPRSVKFSWATPGHSAASRNRHVLQVLDSKDLLRSGRRRCLAAAPCLLPRPGAQVNADTLRIERTQRVGRPELNAAFPGAEFLIVMPTKMLTLGIFRAKPSTRPRLSAQRQPGSLRSAPRIQPDRNPDRQFRETGRQRSRAAIRSSPDRVGGGSRHRQSLPFLRDTALALDHGKARAFVETSHLAYDAVKT